MSDDTDQPWQDEIKALEVVAAALRDLPLDARRRILDWARSRFVDSPPEDGPFSQGGGP